MQSNGMRSNGVQAAGVQAPGMGATFWIRRFLQVLALTVAVIAGAQRLKGHDAMDALAQGLLWGAISTTVFIAARLRASRRRQHCALCRDTPELRAPGRAE